jgi:hypothetical protein
MHWSNPLQYKTVFPIEVRIVQLVQRRATGWRARVRFPTMQDSSLLYSAQTESGPTHLPAQWVMGTLSPGVKQQGREADHSLQSTAEVKKGESIPPILLWFYSRLLGLGHFFSSLIYTQSVGHFGRGIGLSQGRYLHAGQHKHRMNAHRRPCVQWDLNPRSQWLSGRGHWSANLHLHSPLSLQGTVLN